MDQSVIHFKVRMFGGFSLNYEGQEIVLGRNTTAKFIQLLQLVWLQDGIPMSKDRIVRSLYEMDDLSNPNNSFNNLVYQMRRQMLRAELPDKDYIIRKGKLFTEDDTVILDLDVRRFRELINQSRATENPDEKAALYAEALELYTGELLPEAASETWVIMHSVTLQRSFDEAVHFLGEYYKERQDYGAMKKLFARAVLIYPDNEWQAYQIETLILEGAYKEAYKLYDETIHLYADEMGVEPSEKLLECYQLLSAQMPSASGKIDEIQSELTEEESGGAYYCAFPSFIDAYHILSRNMERTGKSIYMMLCTLVDYEGKPIQNQEKLRVRSDALQDTICKCLRRSDVFTKYNTSQYLILLVGTSLEGCNVVFRRINSHLKEAAGSRVEIRYNTVSLADLPDREVQDAGQEN